MQTLLVEEERWLRQSVSGTNSRRGFRAAGARSQLQPSQRFRDGGVGLGQQYGCPHHILLEGSIDQRALGRGSLPGTQESES